MATLDYVSIPSSATRLDGATIRPTKRIPTSLPSTSSSVSTSSTTTLSTPTSGTFAILPQLLLSGSLPPGTIPSTLTDHETSKDGPETKLLTTRDALSIPTTSTNFKRFVARAGPIFWLQDRIEEIVMWRRGWRVTGVWMAAYAFFCLFYFPVCESCLTVGHVGYFPRLILLLPHIALIGTILAIYPYNPDSNSATQASDSSVNWQANLQAIQNLMGFMQVPCNCYSFPELTLTLVQMCMILFNRVHAILSSPHLTFPSVPFHPSQQVPALPRLLLRLFRRIQRRPIHRTSSLSSSLPSHPFSSSSPPLFSPYVLYACYWVSPPWRSPILLYARSTHI